MLELIGKFDESIFMDTTESLDREIANSLSRLSLKQKKTVLTVVKAFINEQKDWWDEISETQQKAIDKSLEEMKAGKLTAHDEVMKSYKKWLKK
jgi:predicted transcriptional regulator